VFGVVVVVGRALWSPVGDLLDVLASGFLAAALVAAVLRRRLEGVRVVVHHTVVYAVLGLGVVAVYVVAAGLLSSAGPELSPFGAGVVAAGAALAVHPLHRRLQRVVDRVMYGDRRDPYAAVSRLAEQAHRAPTTAQALAAVATSVATSLRVPYVRVEAFGHTGEHGTPPGSERGGVREALVAGDAELGSVVVHPQPGRQLGEDERALLRELGRHAGVAVDAVRLAGEVAEHHRVVVTAREEERRRLGRELHDGLGPTVAGISMQLGALRPLVHTDPAAVVARLARLEEAAVDALAGIRRVAYELRPPVLDQVGLHQALAQAAESLGVTVHHEPGRHGPLPAAIELAAYRIAVEALTNVARHSGVGAARLSLRETGRCLVVGVADGGAGLAHDAVPGVGLTVMRERAEEVGGTLSVRPTEGGGTAVTAVLPLGAPVRTRAEAIR
jgi:signal transduction histidine kinase